MTSSERKSGAAAMLRSWDSSAAMFSRSPLSNPMQLIFTLPSGSIRKIVGTMLSPYALETAYPGPSSSVGNVTPYSRLNSFVPRASSCEMAMTVAESPEYRSASRCRYGNVNWHTGHEILKKAATTGPFSSNFSSEYSLPSSDFKVKPGATCPTAILVKGASHPIHLENFRDSDIAAV